MWGREEPARMEACILGGRVAHLGSRRWWRRFVIGGWASVTALCVRMQVLRPSSGKIRRHLMGKWGMAVHARHGTGQGLRLVWMAYSELGYGVRPAF